MDEAGWSVRQMAGRSHGCELSVAWRPDGRWVWTVTVAGDRVASGTAGSRPAAQDAAVAAAVRHARDDGSVQLPLL